MVVSLRVLQNGHKELKRPPPWSSRRSKEEREVEAKEIDSDARIFVGINQTMNARWPSPGDTVTSATL